MTRPPSSLNNNRSRHHEITIQCCWSQGKSISTGPPHTALLLYDPHLEMKEKKNTKSKVPNMLLQCRQQKQTHLNEQSFFQINHMMQIVDVSNWPSNETTQHTASGVIIKQHLQCESTLYCFYSLISLNLTASAMCFFHGNFHLL